MELLVGRIGEGTIVFPSCAERESQYAAHTYSVGGMVVWFMIRGMIISLMRLGVLCCVGTRVRNMRMGLRLEVGWRGFSLGSRRGEETHRGKVEAV